MRYKIVTDGNGTYRIKYGFPFFTWMLNHGNRIWEFRSKEDALETAQKYLEPAPKDTRKWYKA